jgi:outer membrane protein TolC
MNKHGHAAALAGALLALAACANTITNDTRDGRRLPVTPPRPLDAAAVQERAARQASARLPEEADLQAYLAYALQNSATLRAAFEDWRASVERIEQASTLPEPRLAYMEFIEELQTRSGPQQRRFGLSQAFPWPGRLDAQAAVQRRRADAAWQRVEALRLAVARDVEIAYHEYAFLGEELRITGELLELLRGLEPAVLSRIRAGGRQADLLRLQVEIGRLEDDVASFERRGPVRSARLADALTLGPSHAVLPVPRLAVPEPRTIDAGVAFQRALAASPVLRALAEELRASQETTALSGFARKPSFTIGVDYFQTGEALSSSTPGSGDDPVALMLSMSLPVWGASYAAAEREARHATRAARERCDAAESRLRAEVEEEAFRADDAARRITLFRDSLIPRAAESLQLTVAAYRTGSASLLDMIDSERALLEFELSFRRACRDYLQGEARLRALMGEVH